MAHISLNVFNFQASAHQTESVILGEAFLGSWLLVSSGSSASQTEWHHLQPTGHQLPFYDQDGMWQVCVGPELGPPKTSWLVGKYLELSRWGVGRGGGGLNHFLIQKSKSKLSPPHFIVLNHFVVVSEFWGNIGIQYIVLLIYITKCIGKSSVIYNSNISHHALWWCWPKRWIEFNKLSVFFLI